MKNLYNPKEISYGINLRFRAMQQVPGLKPLVTSLAAYLVAYLVFTNLIALTYVLNLPLNSDWEKSITVTGILFLNLFFARACLGVFFGKTGRLRLITAVPAAIVLASAIGLLLFLTISRDVLYIQQKMNIYDVGIRRNIFFQAIHDGSLIMYGDSALTFIGVLVAALSISLVSLPLILVSHYIHSSSYHMFLSYSKIKEAIA